MPTAIPATKSEFVLTVARHLWRHGRSFQAGLHEAKGRVYVMEQEGLTFLYPDEAPLSPGKAMRWALQEMAEWFVWRLSLSESDRPLG